MRILVVTQHFWPENFRINDIVEGFVQDGLSVDVLCGLPNYPKGEWFDGYSADGPFEEVYKGARVFRAREIPRKGNTGKTIFLNYVSWPLYAAGALKRLPGGYDAWLLLQHQPGADVLARHQIREKARCSVYKLCAGLVAGKSVQCASGQEQVYAFCGPGGQRRPVQAVQPADCHERAAAKTAVRPHRENGGGSGDHPAVLRGFLRRAAA